MPTGATPNHDSSFQSNGAGLNVSLIGSSEAKGGSAAQSGSQSAMDSVGAARSASAASAGAASASAALPAGDATSQNEVMVPRSDVIKILELVETAASAKDRGEAVRATVDALASHLPETTIRCAIGGKQLRRVYDPKLGWLGSESSLFAAGQLLWDKRISGETKATAENPTATFTVAIPEPEGEGFCAIWVTGYQAPPYWLMAASGTLRTVIWDRPSRSWLRAPERIRRASSVWVCVLLFALLAIAFWPVQYRIACTAIVQPVQQRLVATPFEATLLESRVSPGDLVQAGDLLVLLDGRPLRLELESVESEIQRTEKEHNVALANGRIAEAQQASLGKRKLVRRRQLLRDRLERLEVVCPIDGVVVSGDLDRYIGSPLEIGQTIVEIAPLDRVTVEIEIPEFEIGYVQPDSDTRVRFASVGGSSIRQKIQSVYPAAELRDDRSVFVAKIELDNRDGKLRPGMRGDATTYGPLRPTSWSWIRGTWERTLWWAGY